MEPTDSLQGHHKRVARSASTTMRVVASARLSSSKSSSARASSPKDGGLLPPRDDANATTTGEHPSDGEEREQSSNDEPEGFGFQVRRRKLARLSLSERRACFDLALLTSRDDGFLPCVLTSAFLVFSQRKAAAGHPIQAAALVLPRSAETQEQRKLATAGMTVA